MIHGQFVVYVFHVKVSKRGMILDAKIPGKCCMSSVSTAWSAIIENFGNPTFELWVSSIFFPGKTSVGWNRLKSFYPNSLIIGIS